MDIGGGSQLILLFLVLTFIALLVMVVVSGGFGQEPKQKSFEATVTGQPGPWLDRLTAAVAGLPKHEIALTPTSAVITRTAIPPWAVAIAVFTLLVARPVAVFVALAGAAGVGTVGKAFMAWFGPKGVATMTFALFVLGSSDPNAARIAGIAALTVFLSIIVHGLTDHPGAEWMAKRSER